MVAVSSPAKVLVTGANGYLAVWVVKKYLEAGYSVRGTVRSLSKSAFLTEKFSNYGDRFELVVVNDIVNDGAFDEAVKGVDVIAHTASPFHYKATHPDGVFLFFFSLLIDAFSEQAIFRSHHSCRERYHIDPELRAETWEHSEAFCTHLIGRRDHPKHHRAPHFHRKQLE